ncbi:MAG: zinc ribbon domain-containing protein [Dehalococcoidia bacterium]|nr:zinc ribbon domain-containing protein [Dehalococcoidia bacterium]
MPIYEYACPHCHHKFELLRPISQSEADLECPKCKTPSKRSISKFVSRSKDDMSFLNHMPASSSSSCSGCSSTNCSSCGL